MTCACLSCSILCAIEEHFDHLDLDFEQKAEVVKTFAEIIGLLFDLRVMIALSPWEEANASVVN